MGLLRKIYDFRITELLVIFIYLFLLNNYIKSVDKVIVADGVGYYDYLPSLFIHHDLNRKDKTLQAHPELYQRIQALGVYNDYEDYKVNMYPVGVSFLQLPFFAIASLQSDSQGGLHEGYQQIYQDYVFYAALFYLFLGLILLRILLIHFGIKPPWIVLIQLLAVLATPLSYYAHFEAAFSHVYSFFAISGFAAYTRKWFVLGNKRDFVWASLFFALVIILRQVNGLALFFVPFLAGSKDILVSRIKQLFNRQWLTLLCGLGVFTSLVLVQLLVWYYQTGHFFVYSYQGYGFNWGNPQFIPILFSFRKGLFIYTPVLLFSFGIFVYWVIEQKFYLLLTWLLPFLLVTYVLSSWFSWFYGCSYGLRAYIEYFPFFFILLALFIQKLSRIGRGILFPFLLASLFLNVIQTHQYRNYILDWIEMDFNKYKTIFLKTDKRYNGLFFKEKIHEGNYQLVKTIKNQTLDIPPRTADTLFVSSSKDWSDLDSISMVKVSIVSTFPDDDNAKFVLVIQDAEQEKVLVWAERYLMHFAEGNFGQQQVGSYYFKWPRQSSAIQLKMEIWTEKNTFYAEDFSIQFFKDR
jgi:hypothetical protein